MTLNRLPVNIVVQSEVDNTIIAIGKSKVPDLFDIVISTKEGTLKSTVELQFLSNLHELLGAHFESNFKDLELLDKDWLWEGQGILL